MRLKLAESGLAAFGSRTAGADVQHDPIEGDPGLTLFHYDHLDHMDGGLTDLIHFG